MKGIIFNIAESFLIDTFGEKTMNEIIDNCNLITKDPFVAPGTYPDNDLVEILVQTTKKVDITMDNLLKDLGRYSFFKLAERHPGFLEPYSSPKAFLLTVEDVIHVEVKKLYSNSHLPTFQYDEPSDNELIITYFSKRKLYSFMEGLIDGVSAYFNNPIHQTHKIYQKNGDEFCDFYLKFENE